ncbi:hypothetical protein L3Q82_019094, partial [Scortum barcoo]
AESQKYSSVKSAVLKVYELFPEVYRHVLGCGKRGKNRVIWSLHGQLWRASGLQMSTEKMLLLVGSYLVAKGNLFKVRAEMVVICVILKRFVIIAISEDIGKLIVKLKIKPKTASFSVHVKGVGLGSAHHS